MKLVSARQPAKSRGWIAVCIMWAAGTICSGRAQAPYSNQNAPAPSAANTRSSPAPFSVPSRQERGNRDDETDRSQSRWASGESSTYVPLDSWVYDAFDRLAALGYIPEASAVLRPWSRLECARLLAEAYLNADIHDEANGSLLSSLNKEFSQETAILDDGSNNRISKFDSAYTRITAIGGTPLRDGFHFGETLANDFGRPYGKGANAIAGFSARAQAGRLSVYLRGEYQYASAIPLYNANAQQVLATTNDNGLALPFGWNLRSGTTNRFRPVELYASFQAANWQLSFGQQSLWWSPDRTSSLILSNNAAPMPMLRLNRVRPFQVPHFLHAGPVHMDMFFARQGGIHYVGIGIYDPATITTGNFQLFGSPAKALVPPPYLWGLALSFKPTANLELGFAHTTIFAGYGRPLNFATFFHTFSVNGNGQAIDPGKRVTEFSFQYHPPFLRKIVLYDEAMAWDDPVQGKFVGRYAMAPGVYIPRFPGLSRLDLRAEGVYTNLPKLPYLGYFYSNPRYIQGYTNYGQILGSWIGRDGAGGKGTATWWFSARNKASVSYRKMTVDKTFYQGGNMNDASANVTWLLRPEIELSSTAQYERWNFPLLGSGAKSNFTTMFEVHFFPKNLNLRK